ncbi:hypothetical protein GCM10008965_54900 [Methylorubrum aminovorans]
MKLASPEKRGVTIPEAGWNRAKRSARVLARSSVSRSTMTNLPRGVLARRIKPFGALARKPLPARAVDPGARSPWSGRADADYAEAVRSADTSAFKGVGDPGSCYGQVYAARRLGR